MSNQLFEKLKSDETIIIGDVLVYKNPCSHPGDIQKMKAVDVP
jgi:hypothetical protein